jgi:hypothetical protein
MASEYSNFIENRFGGISSMIGRFTIVTARYLNLPLMIFDKHKLCQPKNALFYDSAEKPSIKPVRHSEQSEESRVFQDLRPFTSFRVAFRGHSSAESFY